MLEKAFVLYNSLINCWITIPICNILFYYTSVYTFLKLFKRNKNAIVSHF